MVIIITIMVSGNISKSVPSFPLVKTYLAVSLSSLCFITPFSNTELKKNILRKK